MHRTSTIITGILAATTLVLAGAIAGFFYAYSVSVMRGLDAADPQHAIAAMQGINATIRNAAFAPAFFGMPAMAALTGLFLFMTRQRPAAVAMVLAVVVYLLGALVPTFAVNVPLNDALAKAITPADAQEAVAIWSSYSAPWTWWNHLRMAFSTASLLLVGLAIFLCGLRHRP
ncbi:anthrone oxygenase family protein [Taklimakanibacter lacteus]|uniref:anthrone oxygenase family protein n=1 Tax=Taklimakanibacter lacteus TaxID=2268456 RepID=UPI000E66E630